MRRLRFGVALALAAAAVQHVLRTTVPRFGDDDPVLRHALFSLIDGAAAAGFLLARTGAASRIFTAAFAVLTVQQLVSHGGGAWRAWRDQGRVDVVGLVVVVVMPLALALLVADARRS